MKITSSAEIDRAGHKLDRPGFEIDGGCSLVGTLDQPFSSQVRLITNGEQDWATLYPFRLLRIGRELLVRDLVHGALDFHVSA